MRSLSRRVPLLFLGVLPLALAFAGCNAASRLATSSETSAQRALPGKVMGGEQPITASLIQLYAVGAGGDGSTATALITTTITTSDGTGQANSNANVGNNNNQLSAGSFTVPAADFSCPSAGTLVYLAAVGGNPGGGTNNSQETLAALGNCGNLSASTNISMNEVTTVGTVAALYPYMTAYNAVGSGSSDAAALTAAFTTAAEYINFATGTAPGPALPAGMDASSNDVRALANVVQTCVNSTGGAAGSSTPCGMFFTDTTPTSTNVAPTDTVGALIDLFHNPTMNVATIFNLQSTTPPFAPTYPTPPSNWSLPILPIPGTPAFSVPAGSYPSAQGVTITDSAAGAAIYYTTDGSTPTTSSTLYTGPVGVSTPETLSAIAVESTRLVSPVASAAYTGALTPVAPTVTLSSITVPSGSTSGVTITASESGTANTASGSVVTFGVTGTATGSFSPATCTIANGSCSVSYIPTGTLAPATYPNDLTASFTAAGAYTAGSATSTLLISGVVYTQLYSFTGATIPGTTQTDGIDPEYGSLIQASDGNFYGTTSGGTSTAVYGTVFRISAAGVYTQIYAFTGSSATIPGTTQKDGAKPFGGLIQGSDGYLYGTTETGGANNGGTIFRISTNGATYTQLHAFTGATIPGTSPAQTDGSRPYAAPVQGSDGNFYGTTEAGGRSGTVYRISSAGAYAQLHTFTDGAIAGTTQPGTTSTQFDGANPYSPLVQGSDGNFYGTTYFGGYYSQGYASAGGTVFQISPAGAYVQLYAFNGSAYGNPEDALIQGSDGKFYGTAFGDYGVVFNISAADAFSRPFSFVNSAAGNSPSGSLVVGSDGNFYGTNQAGPGSSTTTGYGTVFELSSAFTGTDLHPFTGAAIPGTAQTDGKKPYAGLVQGSDGSFYGTTYGGGAYGATNGYGTLFKLTFSPALAGPVALTVPASVTHGATFTLAYAVSNAFSTAGVTAVGPTTLQNCFATNYLASDTTNTPVDTTGWTGSVTGSTTTQNKTLTAPATAGTYTYALTCGGQESGFATLNVQ